jgi:hypothetical protein
MPESVALGKWGTIAVLALLVAVFIGLAFFIHKLRKSFLEGCVSNNQIVLFSERPMGLPQGTVRSILALLIVVFSITFIAIFGDNVPEALLAILGTVLGFYFGSRGASKDQSSGELFKHQADQLKTAQDDASTGEIGGLLKKVGKGIAMTKAVSAVLPDNLKKKCDDLIGKLEGGVKSVEGLVTDGKLSDAAATVKELYGAFKEGNPAKSVVTKALQSFARVLGTSSPPLALVGSVVGIGAKLTGVLYQKWKARILHLPFSPAVVPLTVVDANTGFSLLNSSPIFKAAFKNELENNDRPFMKSALTDFLRQEDTETVWAKYKDRFESLGQFEEGLEEFRRAAADIELSSAIGADMTAPVSGYKNLVSSIDKLHGDTESKADLDALVGVFEALGTSGEPVVQIFEKVKEEVSS